MNNLEDQTAEGGRSHEESRMSDAEPAVSALVVSLPTGRILPSAGQPRKFSFGNLEELAASIRERGVIQPLLVTHDLEQVGYFRLIAGERRLRAAVLAGLDEVPALVTAVSEQDSLEIALIENAQRVDLNPVEEAIAYQELSTRFGLTHAQIAEAIGKSRVTISNSMRLLSLPAEVIELLKSGELTAGHARALLAIKSGTADEIARTQLQFALKVLQTGMSVRSLEELVSRTPADKPNSPTDSVYERIQERLIENLGAEKVRVRDDSQGRKTVMLRFPSEAAWKRFLAKVKD